MSTQGWIYLVLAIIFEVSWAVLMRVSNGFTVLWANLAMVVTYALSLVFLNLATREVDLGVAYALWTGSGAVLVALMAWVLFKEHITLMRALWLLLIVCGVAGLSLTETSGRRPAEPAVTGAGANGRESDADK
jgi:multidrug transporter EmrE-like cation transporter